jgi:hypothetical protein
VLRRRRAADDDADRATDALIQFHFWIDCTPEPQVELDTAVKWDESLMFLIETDWSSSMIARFRSRLDVLAANGEITSKYRDEWLESLVDYE